MKRTTLLLILFLAFFFLSIVAHPRVCAEASHSPVIQIIEVDHIIEVREGGLTLINDTVAFTVNSGDLDSFSIGFPFEYRFNLDYSFAYKASDPAEQLGVVLDSGLGTIGFYGVTVNFRKPIGSGESYNFTVVFVFSNLVSFKQALSIQDPETGENRTYNTFNVNFPLYPSLPQNVSVCNVEVFLTSDATYRESSLQKEGTDFNVTETEKLRKLSYRKISLSEFTYKPAWLEFTTWEERPEGPFMPLEVEEVERKIILNEFEARISIFDSYQVTNRGHSLSNLQIRLPNGAYPAISGWDELGSLPKQPTIKEGSLTTPTEATIYLRDNIKTNETTAFSIAYQVPLKTYVIRQGLNAERLSFNLLEDSDWIVRKLTVTLLLPEGSEFKGSLPTDPTSVQRSVYQETVIFTLYNTTAFREYKIVLVFHYLVFWASFRPTLWVGAFILFAGLIAILWRAPKAPAPIPTAIPIRPEELRKFVDAYDEERKILQKRESLETQARKGKIPRRLYKVRSRTLESRLSVLSRDLTNLREKIRTAGPRYADLMRQIEVAETELQGVEADLRRTEARYRRGEISAAAYHKLLEDSYRRRDRAKTNIDGVLLRLREEIG